MFEELHELLDDKRISKNELLAILKEKAQKISVFDLMDANQYILQDVEFVQDKYQDDFRQAYVKQFIGHINNIKNDNTDYDSRGKKERIDKKQFEKSLEDLHNVYDGVDFDKDKVQLIYCLVSLYATFILNEPIHSLDTPFPGNLKIKKLGKFYYCPVKATQKNTEGAVCRPTGQRCSGSLFFLRNLWKKSLYLQRSGEQ